MSNPVLVEVTRGDVVESRHRGAIAIFDANGTPVLKIGDTGRRVFPRSAIKALQALPLVESGAADALDYDPAELALACSSHNGEERHVNAARVMLIKAGLEDDALECGPQWPSRVEDVAGLVRAGETPCALHNNCSGKHAGFLGLAKVMGAPTRGYVLPDHPVQQEIKAVLEAMTGDTLTPDICGIDGCAIPTFATPLDGFARAFAAFGTGENLEPLRAEAARRLYDACVDNAFMVAGTDRFCTRAMAGFRRRVFVKTGAEGVFCATIPELGLGIALKCDDGASRASEVMMASILEAFLDLNDDEKALLEDLTQPAIKTRLDVKAGVIRPTSDLLTDLKRAATVSA